MKRLLIALIVCVYIVTAVFSAVLPVTSTAVELDGTAPSETTAATETTETTENTETTESTEASENTEATEDTTESTESSGGEDPLPEETTPVEDEEPQGLQWMSYMDFLYEQVESVYMNPEMYVGYTAIFNDEWTNFICSDDPTVVLPRDECLSVDLEDLVDDQGNSIRVRIVEWIKDENEVLWYKVEAVEGYVLPQILEENPYILQVEYEEDFPSLLIMPVKGMFVGETVDIKNQAAEATRAVTLATNTLPAFFDVIPVESNDGWVGYDLGDVSSWSDELTQEYRYVEESSVMLIPVEVSVAYETLLKAESAEEYEQIWNQLPETVRNKFTDRHLEDLNNRQEELNNVTHSGNVIYNGQTLEVSVSGRIPENVTLSVAPVSYETVMAEGFDVSSATDLITALDIKLLNPNGTEWQPEDGEYLELNIGMAELGVPDGKLVRLHHKHGGVISVQDVFFVVNGKLTIAVTGFSIFVVDSTTDTNGVRINNNGSTSVAIGDTLYLYIADDNNNGTWVVNDPSGAIHYTVHGTVTNSVNIGHNQVKARWIKIVGLKETTTPITLKYNTGNLNNAQTYYLNVTVPVPTDEDVRLYIKDEVNTTGCLVAAVVDKNGNEVSLDGAAFSWSRNDGLFIVPAAYEDDYKAVNIARDHGGLVEARKTDDGYTPVTYTLDVILADGKECSASYTVYYQSEIINAGFEFPDSKYRDYSFFPNGYPELYWKTTAPGTGSGNVTKDIEYGDVTGQTNNGQGETSYGVWRAADADEAGSQFAELNAEEVGALYQDIITAPHEFIEWDFAHAKRPNQTWASNVQNKMYLVIGPTEKAQQLSNDELNTLVRQAREESDSDEAFMTCQRYQKVTFQGAEYWVWYHDADNQTDYTADGDYGWKALSGSYEVPDNQYRTRIFFVSDPDSNSSNKNAGNLIDISSAGQYKEYLIEYYEQTYVDGKLVTKRYDEYQEWDEALVYSSAILKNYNHFVEDEHDYLYKILINGKNYPYDIRYAGQAALYVEKYEGTPTDLLNKGKTYEEFDIVMQVVLRDTVVAVQKELQFPATLTEEQKLTIMEDLNTSGGYKASFALTSPDEGYEFLQEGDAIITNRDPAGKYKGFIALGDNPELEHSYQIEETATSAIPGLELESVTFGVTRYQAGQELDDDLEVVSYDEIMIESGAPLVCTPFKLETEIKIADVTVTNTYKEKMTTIYYQAVGNGKVALTGSTDFVDIPTEQLAFYSGKSVGADIHRGNGATFKGWYKMVDGELVPVTSADGVVDPVTKNFKSNANIINVDEITFYAVFETGTIVIERSDAEPGQSFVYHVSGTTKEGGQKIDFYVTLTCGPDGTGSCEIQEVLLGDYTITEIQDWSWRYNENASQTIDHNGGTETVKFGGTEQHHNWLSDLAEIAKNIFTKVRTTP